MGLQPSLCEFGSWTAACAARTPAASLLGQRQNDAGTHRGH
eukprot:CAMPEP_0175449920 /NCGR_PEP_ID=MMETSP0095-20121207/62094_1 /TAXON_ID=311494 /ORGANISM="Alexandrium monilatum, Strain CCMP3105" /LENGTH=40 /DNA_ID= /DNA_START= /DNA_END= /DNA_ORIENTATION=